MPAFIPGIELSRRFYAEVVRLLLDAHWPGLPHAAALIGPGSEVLSLDTEMSTDHDWGPRVFLFLRDEDAHLAAPIRESLSRELPHVFCGYPVGTADASSAQAGAAPALTSHRVLLTTVRTFLRRHLVYDVDRPLTAADWLTFPSQKLLELTAGAVYHDDTGELSAVRELFHYYPHDIWLYLLAAAWQRIGQEEHLMPRAAYVGDELGSAIIGSRLVRDAISLSFLIERQYAPYPKWFGTAFAGLRCAPELTPALWRALRAATWQEREAGLCQAYECLARAHNALGITPRLPEAVSRFYDRPFQVIQADAFAQALCAAITDPVVKQIAARPLIGGIDQWSDSTDMCDPSWRAVLRSLYTP